MPQMIPRLLVDLAKLVFSGALIWLAFSKIDVRDSFALLSKMQLDVIALAILTIFIQHTLGGLRFHHLLEQLKTPISKLAALENVFVGFFFSQIFISFIGGDAIRVWRLVNINVPVSNAFKSVLFDRLLGFVSLILLIMLCVPPLFGIVTNEAMRTSILITIGVGICATAVFLSMHRLPRYVQRWKMFQIASDISVLALSISGRYTAIGYLLGLSLLIQISNVVAIYLIAQGLGIDAHFMDLLVLIPPVMLLAILPISYAGWGVREGSMALVLALVGIPAEQSVAISICFGLCMIASGLPGAISWLKTRKKVEISTFTE